MLKKIENIIFNTLVFLTVTLFCLLACVNDIETMNGTLIYVGLFVADIACGVFLSWWSECRR